MRCTYCGAELDENAWFCIKCGNRVGEISQAERFSAEDNMQMMQGGNIQKSRTGTIIVLIVFVLLVSVIALLCIKVFVKEAPDGQEKTQTVREWNYSETEQGAFVTTEVTEDGDLEEDDIESVDKNKADKDKADIEETAAEEKDSNDVAEDSDYIIPYSDSQLLTEEDVEDLTLWQVNYAKNEIYARHGYIFESNELQNYFGSKSWYSPCYERAEFDQVVRLSDVENKNAAFLSRMEKEKGGPYQLDR